MMKTNISGDNGNTKRRGDFFLIVIKCNFKYGNVIWKWKQEKKKKSTHCAIRFDWTFNGLGSSYELLNGYVFTTMR